jgi:hypothetical protein
VQANRKPKDANQVLAFQARNLPSSSRDQLLIERIELRPYLVVSIATR